MRHGTAYREDEEGDSEMMSAFISECAWKCNCSVAMYFTSLSSNSFYYVITFIYRLHRINAPCSYWNRKEMWCHGVTSADLWFLSFTLYIYVHLCQTGHLMFPFATLGNGIGSHVFSFGILSGGGWNEIKFHFPRISLINPFQSRKIWIFILLAGSLEILCNCRPGREGRGN